MNSDSTAGLLQIIAASVTPVVMISAAAVLILGINNKHQALSDRLRNLAAEYRSQSISAARRLQIAEEVALFRRRIGFSSMAHRALYVAIVCFFVVMLLIFFAPPHLAWTRGALWLFGTAVLLMLGAIIMELLELQLGRRTLEVELCDVHPASR